MTDRLDRAEDGGPEQLAGAGGEGGRGPLADLAHHHVGADPLQRGGPAFEVDDQHGGGHDRDQAGDQQALRREPPAPGRRQRGPGAGTRAAPRRGVERDGGAHDVGERGALHAVGVAAWSRREPDARTGASAVPEARRAAGCAEAPSGRCRFSAIAGAARGRGRAINVVGAVAGEATRTSDGLARSDDRGDLVVDDLRDREGHRVALALEGHVRARLEQRDAGRPSPTAAAMNRTRCGPIG